MPVVVAPGVGVNNPAGWFANAAKADEVGSMKADGVREGVNRNGSASARGVGSRSACSCVNLRAVLAEDTNNGYVSGPTSW